MFLNENLHICKLSFHKLLIQHINNQNAANTVKVDESMRSMLSLAELPKYKETWHPMMYTKLSESDVSKLKLIYNLLVKIG